MFEPQLDEQLTALGQQAWLPALHALLTERLSPDFHGDFHKWQIALKRLPPVTPSRIDLNSPAITVGTQGDLTQTQHRELDSALRTLHPWRKGPFDLFGIYIDTEWRSDWKWDRLKGHITSLEGRSVLDIGCGSGYHCWRMRGAGAQFVLGIDPTLLFVMQFDAVQHFIRDAHVHVLPLGIDDLPGEMHCFDTVFSMGLLYHRREPQAHLHELKACLKPGGELVLETLVIDSAIGELLIPEDRYAQMRNVWAIPSVPLLIQWLEEAGYHNVRCVDVTVTSTDEQRSTDWMQFQSLADYLDPDDHSKTIEGHPAPMRAILIANT